MKISTKNQRGRRKRKEVEVGTKEGIFLLHESLWGVAPGIP